MFQRITEANLKLKASKCNIARESATFLGHIVTRDGIKPNQENLSAVRSYSIPKNVKQTRSFLGLVCYYQRFIKNFSKIAAPLYNLTRLGVKFQWDANCQQAFDILKQRLVEEPLLVYPDFTQRFILTTDASSTGLGFTLSQRINGKERPILYGGRQFSAREQKASVTEREALAIIVAVKKCHAYLHGKRFTIVTDHQPLNYIFNSKEPTGKITRWALLLQSYDYDVEYRPGRQNGSADALSRRTYEGDFSNEDDIFLCSIADQPNKTLEECSLENDISDNNVLVDMSGDHEDNKSVNQEDDETNGPQLEEEHFFFHNKITPEKEELKCLQLSDKELSHKILYL